MQKIVILILIILILGTGFYLLSMREKQAMIEEIKTKSVTATKKLIEKTEISIITIYDNYQADSRLKTGWGFSALVKLANQNILFDTGADSVTLLSNMEKMTINPREIDFAFISHLHQDHTGGLPGILKIKPDLKVYKPESFSSPTQIMNDIWTTGPLGNGVEEQSLIINSEPGLIIITGCAHPGIVNIIKKTKEMFPAKNIYLVLGGFHLTEASDSELKGIIADFKELGVQKVAPCHCSGDRCRELFQQEYQDNFIKNGVGKIIEI